MAPTTRARPAFGSTQAELMMPVSDMERARVIGTLEVEREEGRLYRFGSWVPRSMRGRDATDLEIAPS
jgi:hypothetical protein